MNLFLHSKTNIQNAELQITGSKSESNRLLLLQALYPELKIANLSNSDDSEAMTHALHTISKVVDIHHAGTAMRFLTAFFAQKPENELVLTGSSRMQERPIGILVDALRQLGADISYEKNEGFPPLKIKGKKLTQNKVTIAANVSSQFISALLLIAPKLENGIELTLVGEITSVPYIKMTLSLLESIGVSTSFKGNIISIQPHLAIENSKTNTIVESDWSSASYWYSIVALSEVGTQISLSSYKENSLQGDASLNEIYKNFGVETHFTSHSIVIKKAVNIAPNDQQTTLKIDLNNSPDIAQTIAVTAFGLQMECYLTGLHTLKVKETDRLVAMKKELEKFGATVDITDSTLLLHKRLFPFEEKYDLTVNTYQDHRMAMAFAPLALKTSFIINEAEVVSKSYPDFWEDLKKVGFTCEEV